MGIADFGVDANQNPLVYSTSTFYGTTVLRSLSVYNAALSSAQMTIQLNVVLQFSSGGSEYYYWVQDVAFIDTSSNTIAFENNIWNLSSISNSIAMGSIVGNGTVYSNSVYIASASLSLPGNNVVLSYPATVVLRAGAAVVGGTPEALFDYNDGSGWVRYDTASFVWTNAVTSALYTVDGYGTLPNALFENAELTLGGPGNGANTTASAADLSMSLAYFNGHNIQQVLNAYNFGSDTAEAISGVTEARAVDATNGSLSAHVTYGSGSPANLYDRSYSAIVNISSPRISGTLEVSGTTGVPFQGYLINLTLAPGSYQFIGLVGGVPFGSVNATIVAGEYIALNLGAPPAESNVTFSESGLPPLTSWSVRLGASTMSSTGRTILFVVPVGIYTFAVGLVPGYLSAPGRGNINANARDVTESIIWSQATYSVSFTEEGLPVGASWGVHLSGADLTATVPTINVAEPNGSYLWSALSFAGYAPLPKGGTAGISGAAYSVVIHWSRVLYPVRVTETGLPTGTLWSAQVNTTTLSGTTATLTFSFPNGSYPYSIPHTGNFTPTPSSGRLTVAGGPSPLTVSFAPVPGRLTGLVEPGSAELLVNGTPVPLVNGSYELELSPSTYNITVTELGYQTYSNTTVQVDSGTVLFLNITLTKLPTPVTKSPGPGGLFGLSWLELGVLAAVIVAVGAGVGLALRRRDRPTS
jgi:thermopsin